MKISNRMLSVLCATTLTMGVAAQQPTIRLGYCNGDKISSSLISQNDPTGNDQLCAAILIKKETLEKYEGDTIYQISFANEEKAGSFMTVFIKTDLQSTGGTVQNITNHKEGWNDVKLNKPYVIKADKDIYIGYVSYPSADEVNTKRILSFEREPGGTPGVNWYGINGQWWVVDSRTIDYDLCIRAYVKGKKYPSLDLGLDRVSNYDIVRQNTPTTLDMQVTNYGVSEVTGFTLEAQYKGETFATADVKDIKLPHNEMTKVKIPNLVFPLVNNIDFNVVITKINGGADEDASDNTRPSYVYVMPENAEPQPITILFEEFTSGQGIEPQQADSVYGISCRDRNDVIWVKHHVSDALALPEESPYAWFFDNNATFTPAVMVNRQAFENTETRGPALFIPYNEYVTEMFDVMYKIPSFATLDVNVTRNLQTGKATAKVNINSQVTEMPHQKSLRLTVYAVEDQVKMPGSDYAENGIIRKIVNGTWGTVVDLSNYTYSEDFTFDIDPSWKADDMRIVAFLNNYDYTDPLNSPVYNSAEARLATSGISVINDDSNARLLTFSNRRFVVPAGYTVAVYDASGRKVANDNLKRGVYVVRVTGNDKAFTYKKCITD
ncbi:MAG: Omp28-related outer membrane protein [Prevotella sp.]|uniref:Omp28-related outer membrane protein n=1 Tax=Prevotella sp. TaxID=59823 RepID=UPI002A80A6BA|nr:Omp28-related outer membrane protein [Prevotella sp.]MDY4019497.1 Omp28-related outer membrane protein [Prevotella sp.]